MHFIYECEQCGKFVEEEEIFILYRKGKGQDNCACGNGEYLCGGCMHDKCDVKYEKEHCGGGCENCACGVAE